MWIRKRALIAICSLAACTQPVKRDTLPVTGQENPDAPTNPDIVKKRIWILPFALKSPPVGKEIQNIDIRDNLQGALMKVFSKPSTPFLADITDDSALKTVTIDSGSATDDILRIGREAGIGAYVSGQITEFSFKQQEIPEGLLRSETVDLKLSVDFELHDSVTGRKLYNGAAYQIFTESRSKIFSGDAGTEGLDKKVEYLSQSISEKILSKLQIFGNKLGWQGHVVRMDGPRIYVNSGRRSGIQVGDTLRVVDRPREIVDPQNGTVIGEAPGRVKATIKVTQHFGLDATICALLSGGNVQAGDRVELN